MLPTEPADEVTAEVFETFAREGRDPIVLYRVLAHSPLMLRAYAGLARGLRYEAQTPRALRELMILRTAQLTDSRLRMGAPSRDGARRRRRRREGGRARAVARERALRRDRAGCDARVEGIHAVALSTTRRSRRSSAPSARTRPIELVLLASFYECVARMIQALGLEVEPAYEPSGSACPTDSKESE